VELVDELFSPDFLDHYTARGGPPGRDGIRTDVERVRSLFPDLVIRTGDIICEGDRAALRWTGEGTYQGGIPGTAVVGTRVNMSGMHFYRIRDGQIVERWVEFDGAAVMRQPGAANP
jgi:predicted ester cyclase